MTLRVLHLLDNSNLGGIQELILRLHLYSRHTHDFKAADGSMAEELRNKRMVLWGGAVPLSAYDQYDVIVGHGVGGWSYHDDFWLAHGMGKKTVEVMHSIARSLTPYEDCDGFIALSDLALQPNLRMPRAKRIYVPVETHLFTPPKEKEPGYAIGKLCRLAAEKRPWEFAQLARLFPDERFLLAGDGPERDRIQQENIPNLHLYGVVRDLPGFYKLLKLFVFPTKDECCSAAVAQAQAQGLVVICQDTPALRETTDGHAIFCKSEFEFEAAIKAFLRHPDAFMRLGHFARFWAQEQFAINVTVEAWDQYLEETVGSS